MPDFVARAVLTGGSGVSVAAWSDPEGPGGEPSRINPVEGREPRHWIVAVGANIDMETVVDGVAAPADATLERLFSWWVAEYPGGLPAILAGQSADSSTARIVPDVAGHYVVGVTRPGGGTHFLHFDAA